MWAADLSRPHIHFSHLCDICRQGQIKAIQPGFSMNRKHTMFMSLSLLVGRRAALFESNLGRSVSKKGKVSETHAGRMVNFKLVYRWQHNVLLPQWFGGITWILSLWWQELSYSLYRFWMSRRMESCVGLFWIILAVANRMTKSLLIKPSSVFWCNKVVLGSEKLPGLRLKWPFC